MSGFDAANRTFVVDIPKEIKSKNYVMIRQTAHFGILTRNISHGHICVTSGNGRSGESLVYAYRYLFLLCKCRALVREVRNKNRNLFL